MAKIITKEEKKQIISALQLPAYTKESIKIIKDQLFKLVDKEVLELWCDDKHNVLIYDHEHEMIVVLEGDDPSALLKGLIRSLQGKITYLQANLGPTHDQIMSEFDFMIRNTQTVLGNTVQNFIKMIEDPLLGTKVKAYIDKPLGFLHSYSNQENMLNQGYFIDDEQNCCECLIVNEKAILDQFQGYVIAKIEYKDELLYLLNAKKSYIKDDIIRQLGPWTIEEEKITWLKEEA